MVGGREKVFVNYHPAADPPAKQIEKKEPNEHPAERNH